MNFRKVRTESLKLWLIKTKRRRHINDVTLDAIECHWQNKYVTNGTHNSFFCSTAEWNTHITDLLKDTSFDKYEFNKKGNRAALFRHYSRIMLIVSEILTDFQDFVRLIERIDQNQARTRLTDLKISFTFQQLFEYINAICKHKVGQNSFNKYHYYNHHIDYFFIDSEMNISGDAININNVKTIHVTGKEKLEIPKLSEIIEQVLYGYLVIDNSLKRNYKKQKYNLARFERVL